jgi:hypothetical protein
MKKLFCMLTITPKSEFLTLAQEQKVPASHVSGSETHSLFTEKNFGYFVDDKLAYLRGKKSSDRVRSVKKAFLRNVNDIFSMSLQESGEEFDKYFVLLVNDEVSHVDVLIKNRKEDALEDSLAESPISEPIQFWYPTFK